MMDKPPNRELQDRLARIEELIQTLEGVKEETTRAQIQELVQSLLELHATGLRRTLEVAYDAVPDGDALIAKMAQDDVVSNLLLLHDLHPLDLETRVRNAIEAVQPRLGLHGGSVELLGVSPEGRVHLKLQGNCHECPSSRLTLRFSIEEALNAAAPDLTGLDVDGLPDETPKPAADGPPAIPKFVDCPLPNGAGEQATAGATL
ncbi:MAG: NifU family protein [Chthoniobacterales bacterium]